jgi:hypothetical protein
MLHEQIQFLDEYTKHLPELILTNHDCSEENGCNAQEQEQSNLHPEHEAAMGVGLSKKLLGRAPIHIEDADGLHCVAEGEAAWTRPPRRQRRATGCPRGPAAAPSRPVLQRVGREPVPAARMGLFELRVQQLGASIKLHTHQLVGGWDLTWRQQRGR